jgi:hypothetical protein
MVQMINFVAVYFTLVSKIKQKQGLRDPNMLLSLSFPRVLVNITEDNISKVDVSPVKSGAQWKHLAGLADWRKLGEPAPSPPARGTLRALAGLSAHIT